MNVDLNHVEASSRRFHKTSILLAEKASGVEEANMPFHPVIITSDERTIWALTVPGDTDRDFYTPYIVNASLSIEILLKWILYIEKGTWVKGHSLIKLFELMSRDSKKAANTKFHELVESNEAYKSVRRRLKNEASISIPWNLASILYMSATSFENWRYAFELKRKSCFLCYIEIYNALCYAKGEIC